MSRHRYVLYIAAPVLAYLAVLILVAALHLDLPTLGWIGLGVVVAISLTLVAGASVLFPRMRTNVDPVVGTAPAGREVIVVAPVLPSPLHYVTGDEEREVAEAEARLATAVGRLEAKGVRAHGVVGGDDALQSIGDTLMQLGPHDVVLAMPQASHWSADDLVERARTIAPHVERVVV